MKTDVLGKVAETFKVLADETRLRIFKVLGKRELCVKDISKRTGVSQSAVSHQLRVLRQADLVRAQKRGKNVYYRVADWHVKCIIDDCTEHVSEG